MTLQSNANYLIIYKAKMMDRSLFKFAIIIFIVLLVSFVIIFYNSHPKIDSALLLLGASALIWAYLKQQYHHFEGFKNDSPIKLEEQFTAISKDLVQYFTVFDKRSYADGQKEWKNIVKIKGFNCDTSMTLTKIPKYYVQTGIELGENSLIGPLSNTMNIKFGSPYTICFAVTMKQLSSSSKSNIELFKMYANSPNNNGIHLYISKDSIDTANGNNSASLYFQFADKEPVLCRLSPKDDKINFPQNTLLLFIIVRQGDRVRVLMINEKTDKIEEIALLNSQTSDMTFSNKELAFNRLGNWNANMFNVAVFNNALDDIRATTYYMYVKDLYTKYNNPAYLDALKKWLDSLKENEKLKQCPFPKDVCAKCTSVDDWSNFGTIINAPLSCKQSIANYCTKNPEHSFCECWNKASPKYSTTTCALLRAIYYNDKDAMCESVCNVPRDKSVISKLEYKDNYTFDKVKVKYSIDEDTTDIITNSNTVVSSTATPSPNTYSSSSEGNTLLQRFLSIFV